PVATVAIAPTVDTLPLGGTRTFQATLRDAGGTTLTGRSVSWRSSVDSIATVSSAGVVNALSPGTVTITAASEGRSALATLVVLSRLASSVTLTPANATLIVGGTLTLQAQVTDASGNVLPGRPIDFTSTNTAVATISTGGVITALAPGTTRIVATSEGRTGSASITVIPVPVASVQVAPATASLALGAGTQLTASARAANGTELTGRTITWTSGAPSIATVSSTGFVVGASAGVAVVIATVDGVSGAATITVRRPEVATVAVSPENPSIQTGATLQLFAAARDAGGTTLLDRPATWSSADDTVAFVSSTGLVIGVRPGSAVITAIVEGVRGTTLVTVR
ncbi:MAG: Ig-like domain-containing protein, partial [Gemmatimonadaceae bacterium]|nr:Ig-like domain-containing protein [Gemmatimonadaceae bacterium]